MEILTLNLMMNSYLPLILILMLFANAISKVAVPPVETYSENKIIETIVNRGIIWSCCIHTPIIFFNLFFDCGYPAIFYSISIVGNWILHIMLEDCYYRTKKISYTGLQFYSVVQIIVLWIIYMIGY